MAGVNPLQPRTSVIIPTYNNARFLMAAIESALSQTCRPREVIVVDDASTDETSSVLSEFGDRVRVIVHQENLGLPSARNSGIRVSSGELIGFLDADDKWMPCMIERQEAEFDECPEIGLSFTSLTDCNVDLELSGRPRKFRRRRCERVFTELYLDAFPMPPSTVFVRRSVFDSVGYFDESMLMKQDYECWLRIAMVFPVSCIPESLCLRRHQSGSLTLSSRPESRLLFEKRAFELCGQAAEKLGVSLPMAVGDRIVLSQRRRLREMFQYGDAAAAATYRHALELSGSLSWSDRGVWLMGNLVLRLRKYWKCLNPR